MESIGNIKKEIKDKLKALKDTLSTDLYESIIKYTDEKEIFKGKKIKSLEDFDLLLKLFNDNIDTLEKGLTKLKNNKEQKRKALKIDAEYIEEKRIKKEEKLKKKELQQIYDIKKFELLKSLDDRKPEKLVKFFKEKIVDNNILIKDVEVLQNKNDDIEYDIKKNTIKLFDHKFKGSKKKIKEILEKKKDEQNEIIKETKKNLNILIKGVQSTVAVENKNITRKHEDIIDDYIINKTDEYDKYIDEYDKYIKIFRIDLKKKQKDYDFNITKIQNNLEKKENKILQYNHDIKVTDNNHDKKKIIKKKQLIENDIKKLDLDMINLKKEMNDFIKKNNDEINELKLKREQIKKEKFESINRDKLKDDFNDELNNLIKDLVVKTDEFVRVSSITSLFNQERKTEITIERNENIPLFTFLNTIIRRLPENQLYVLRAGDKNDAYTLNNTNRDRLLDMLRTDFTVYNKNPTDYDEHTFSDSKLVEYLLEINKITIYKKDATNAYKTKKGAFFKYYHLTDLDLSKYQVFKKNDVKEKYEHTCLVYALIQGGLNDIKLNQIKAFVKHREIPATDFEFVCNKLEISIMLYTLNDKPHKYGTSTLEVYNIGLIEDHYFIIDKTKYTSYSILNYFEIKDLPNFHKKYIYRKDKNKHQNCETKRYESIRISSFELLKIMYDNQTTFLEKINLNNCSKKAEIYHEKIENLSSNLHYNPKKDTRLIKINKKIYNDLIIPEDTDTQIKLEKDIKELEKRIKNNVYENAEIIEYDELEEAKYEEEVDKFQNIFFDFETLKKTKTVEKPISRQVKDEDIHEDIIIQVAMLIVFSYEIPPTNGNLETDYYTGKSCAWHFLNHIPNNSRLIAHNSNFDYHFLIKHLQNIRLIRRANRFISLRATFQGKNIEIKDSYLYINYKLEKFNELFKLKEEYKKTVMPYDLLTEENVEKEYVKIDDGLYNIIKKYVKKEDLVINNVDETLKNIERKKNNYFKYRECLKDCNIFKKNIEDWNCKKDDTFNLILYTRFYCIQDVLVLKEGYKTFNNWCIKDFGASIDTTLTISSYVHKYLIREGVYDGVYELSNVPRIFISKCIVGGRTMLNQNKQCHYKYDGVQFLGLFDLDAVSLYASATSKIGFLKGIPKVLETTNYDDIKKYDGYFIEVKIKKINFHLDFPLLSIKDSKTGVRDYTNDMEEQIVYLDKTGTEDLITFHHLKNEDFEIIRGYYFDEGWNYKCQEVIKFLFNKRKELKNLFNPAELIYKTMLCSTYGKTILKEVPYETKIYSNHKNRAEKYWSKNYNKIHSHIENFQGSNNWVFKVYKTVSDHWTIPQVGVEILSNSKRIMNRVFYLAQILGIKIYYQDTDSMHIEKRNFDLLVKKYKEDYKEELIGKELGQFHNDFSIYDENGNKIPCDEIIVIEAYFLAKKAYTDELQGIRSDNKEFVYDEHTRLKGIGDEGIEYMIDSINNDVNQKLKYGLENDIKYDKDIFNILYKKDKDGNGQKIKFDTTQDGNKLRLKFHNDFTVQSLTESDKEISFN